MSPARGRTAQSATALADATFSESTPWSIGIITVESAAARACRAETVALGAEVEGDPLGRVRGELVEGHGASSRARAATWNPAASRMRRASGHSGIRVHGTWSTVPMLTRTLRR